MPGLQDAYGGAADEWANRRLYLGTALLFVGAVVAAPGLVRVAADGLVLAGVAPAVALQLGIALAGLAAPVVGAGLLATLPAGREFRAVAAGGVVLAALSVAVFVATVPPASLAGPRDVPTGLLAVYALGALTALWAPVVAAGLVAYDRTSRRPRSMSKTAFVRNSPSRPHANRVPADGGDDARDVRHLLDEDDR